VQRADLAAAIGSFSSRHTDGEPYDQWGSAAVTTLGGGYYWTDHLKTEVEVGWTGTRHTYGTESAGPDVAPYARIYQEHTYTSTLVSLAQAWQGGRNTLFHPFVSAGITLDRERHALDRPAQSLPTATTPATPNRRIPALTARGTTLRAWPFTSFGFKAYFTPRAFFRTDLTLGIDAGVNQVSWKARVGVDF
jgi:hypothetical protein